jgi:hypothetical protein
MLAREIAGSDRIPAYANSVPRQIQNQAPEFCKNDVYVRHSWQRFAVGTSFPTQVAGMVSASLK